MGSKLKRWLALVISFVLIISFLVVNDTNVYAASSKVSKVEVTNLKKKTLTLNKGSKKTLSVNVSVTGKKTSKQFTVKSSNKKVVVVKKSGKKVILTAKKDGKANITITSKADKKKKTVVKVSVVTPVKGITMSTSKATIKQGKTLQLKATVSSDATNKKLTWSSSNTGVATVSSTGLVTAKKAGTATITAKAQDGSGKKATCVVKVDATNSINSLKVIEPVIVEVVLDYPQKLSKENFAVHNKLMSSGNYVASCEIESIETSDNKKYMIYLSEYIVEDSCLRVTVSGLTGVSTKATKEIIYKRETKVITDDTCIRIKCGDVYEETIYPHSVGYGYFNFTNTDLPPGLKVEDNGYGRAKISGVASKSGVYNTTFTFTDELGNIEIIDVTFVVGDANTLTAYAKPVYNVTRANGKYSLEKSYSSVVYAAGGSGSYDYEIVENKYGISLNASGYIKGTFYKAGTYKISIKVTDKNNKNLTKTVVWTINLKQGITVSGIVKDATGQSLENLTVEFRNVDENDKYYSYNNDDSDSTGCYGVEVPVGTYAIIVYNEYTLKYVGRKTITSSESGFDIVVPLYKVIIYSDNAQITKFGTWYDSKGNIVGDGDCVYLRAGTYSLKSEGNCFEGKYTAILNATVNSSKELTAKVTIQQVQRQIITLGQTIDGKINEEYTYFKFVPTETGTYYFYSSSSYDTYGAIFDEKGTMLTAKDSGGKGGNFEISYKFTAGETYYLGARRYSGSSYVSSSVTVSTTSSTATN